jgi:hypothetical protein
MRIKLTLASLLISAFVTPVLAADNYYVVRDKDTKKCSVVKEQPKSTNVIQLGGGDSYKTEAEARDCAVNQ